MPISERLELLSWAKKVNGIIIEDDYDSELRYRGQPIPSLQGLHPEGNTVYLGTFSKSLAPSLRIGYMILPRPLLGSFRSLFKDYRSSVPLWEQKTLQKFIEQGHWDRHLRKLLILYRKKHAALINAIQYYFGDKAVILSQNAGLHIVIEITGKYPVIELSQRAKTKGVCVYPVINHSLLKNAYQNTLMLGFGSMSPAEISQGIELLSQVCLESRTH